MKVTVSMRGNDRVPTDSGEHTPRQMPGTGAQLVVAHALQYYLVEADAWNLQSGHRRSDGHAFEFCLAYRARPVAGVRDFSARLLLHPLASREIRPIRARRILTARVAEHEGTGDTHRRRHYFRWIGAKPGHKPLGSSASESEDQQPRRYRYESRREKLRQRRRGVRRNCAVGEGGRAALWRARSR